MNNEFMQTINTHKAFLFSVFSLILFYREIFIFNLKNNWFSFRTR